jgi:TPP-dependent pyruvate/acetoin dehydrogenase alpha subunit
MPVLEVDGTDVEMVWNAAEQGIYRARNGEGPTFLMATCPRLEGHLLGDSMVRIAKKPGKEMSGLAGPLLRSFFGVEGASLGDRTNALSGLVSSVSKVAKGQLRRGNDPLYLLRKKLKNDSERLNELEQNVAQEIQQVVNIALATD